MTKLSHATSLHSTYNRKINKKVDTTDILSYRQSTTDRLQKKKHEKWVYGPQNEAMSKRKSYPTWNARKKLKKIAHISSRIHSIELFYHKWMIIAWSMQPCCMVKNKTTATVTITTMKSRCTISFGRWSLVFFIEKQYKKFMWM